MSVQSSYPSTQLTQVFPLHTNQSDVEYLRSVMKILQDNENKLKQETQMVFDEINLISDNDYDINPEGFNLLNTMLLGLDSDEGLIQQRITDLSGVVTKLELKTATKQDETGQQGDAELPMSNSKQDVGDQTELLDRVAQLEQTIQKLKSKNEILQTETQKRKDKEMRLMKENERLRDERASFQFQMEMEKDLMNHLLSKMEDVEGQMQELKCAFECSRPKTANAATQTKSWWRWFAEGAVTLAKNVVISGVPSLLARAVFSQI